MVIISDTIAISRPLKQGGLCFYLVCVRQGPTRGEGGSPGCAAAPRCRSNRTPPPAGPLLVLGLPCVHSPCPTSPTSVLPSGRRSGSRPQLRPAGGSRILGSLNTGSNDWSNGGQPVPGRPADRSSPSWPEDPGPLPGPLPGTRQARCPSAWPCPHVVPCCRFQDPHI
jgi:hypothetical protein